ncbi:MAG TPA: metal-dependent hydrolase [Aquabacterium sp.]|uniref:metal-dependent hydrolase n=1 Tax=Aquabacterium sp. TaxID=1872578 RepID=UPI002E330228|nr:metal-dependent hydrolase [Aquabacterium sp.]HEX5355318.1 metal-dependent hydrolase [Aquabacterium sp.]
MSHESHTASPHEDHAPIVPREGLDFGLDGDIPKYWMANDPFKTRFFDAMSTLFPMGEKFFITSVREFRDGVTSPKLQQEVKDFIRQEAQHTLIHRQFNDRLKAQGVDIDDINAQLETMFFVDAPKLSTPTQRLAATAALEHLTSMMCTCFFERKELLEASDPRVRAMYAWHAIEEVEHKAVAFDVLTQVAKAGYFARNIPMLGITFGFPITVARIMNHMFKVDGFNLWQRTKLWARGLWWFYKPGGLFIPTLGYYMAYYKPGFHPWKVKEMPSYKTWLQVFERTGDPIAAGNALHAAGQ